jgi:aminoglycoside phosphotransferase (APT) family kinase protein
MLYINEQKKSPITTAILNAVADRHSLMYNSHPASISYTNDVFEVKLLKENSYLKFFTNQFCDNNAGMQEVDIAKKVKTLGLPSPEIISYMKADSVVPRNYAIIKTLEGEQLCKLNDEESESVTTDIVNIIDLFKTLEGQSGFYLHNPEVHNTFSTHKGFLEDIMLRGYVHLKNRGFEFNKLKNNFDSWDVPLEQEKYVLCHNDITPKHILLNNGIVSGILDFEWSYFGQKESDYAQWLVSLGINGFEKSVEKSYSILQSQSNPELLAYYAARQFLIAGVWTHQNVKQPEYTNTCLNNAIHISENKKLLVENLIWKGGSPIK